MTSDQAENSAASTVYSVGECSGAHEIGTQHREQKDINCFIEKWWTTVLWQY